MTVRIRGIYATALTALLEDIVQASPPIRERFEATLPAEPAAAGVATTDDRQGVVVSGEPDRVAAVVGRLRDVAVDTLAWDADLPLGGVYAGTVTEELRPGAVVDCGDGEGFLPYSETERHVETGDSLRVQVAEPAPPWADDRPRLETTVRVPGHLVELVRGGTASVGTGSPELADLVPTEPPEGWAPSWGRDSDDADLNALDEALAAAAGHAEAIDAGLADGPPVGDGPHRYWAGLDTAFVWFGRESRFALDERRREVTATMPGHHRVKAGARAASAAVDFVEAVCPEAGAGGSRGGSVTGDGGDAFPFGAVTRQFGPREGDTVRLDHGKPDGRRVVLGEADVIERDTGGTIRVRREMASRGTYDALGTERRPGDVAVTKLTEGKWWYPTVYRSADGESRGTYVNVCTPVEVFPEAVRYVDLHVDVVKRPDGTVERVDDDELDAAVEAGEVPEPLAERARQVADAVENAL
ncbi:DUF402 domain-containing protein [Salinirussus salinus]|uniref:DUF402 domain-containing protein n=1 Tax=Salinirussus salinus TaxID=1198300 RepID=UPI00135976D9|nr:DUF402 domain-containing protein [Salinirussus salinus]